MMFANWKKRSRPWSLKKRRKGSVNQNDQQSGQPSLAIHHVFDRGRAPHACVPQEWSQGSLLVVVQRFDKIPAALLDADELRKLFAANTNGTKNPDADRASIDHVCNGSDHKSISRWRDFQSSDALAAFRSHHPGASWSMAVWI